MKNIQIRLKGGLGNQQFQYAIARAYSLEHSKNAVINTSLYNSEVDRTLEILRYKINSKVNFNSSKIAFKVTSFLSRNLNLRYNKYLKSYNEIESYYDEKIFKLDINLLDGYFQSFKYFDKFNETIKEDLSLNKNQTTSGYNLISSLTNINIDKKKLIAVHIRRGDYLTSINSKIYNQISLNYYISSIKYISSILNNAYFLIFSDDINWCKQNLKLNHQHTFIDLEKNNQNQLIDQDVMRLCDHFIISNSTYSWWAAYLSAGSESIVISPSKWYLHHRYNINDIIPCHWLKFDV